jgi:thiol-disulfide isomerase/thioredoxin
MVFVFMSVLDPQSDTPALLARLRQRTGLTIACYCAAWCDTCTKYRPDFNALAEKWPQHAFVWIDIEESEALLDDEDVENFPTVLIQGNEGNFFFGTLLPYISHLDRMISRVEDSSPIVVGGPGRLLDLLEQQA